MHLPQVQYLPGLIIFGGLALKLKMILHAMIIFLLQYRFKQNNQYRSEMKRKCTQYLIKLEFKFRLA